MVQQTLSFVLNPGITVEWFVARRGYWRTAEYVRTIKRGHRRGKIEIRPTGGIPKKRLFIRPEYVKPMGSPSL